STLRDGFGLLGDYGVEYGVNVANLYRGYKTYPLGVVNAVDQRAAIDFRYYGSGSPFEYETIRFLYVHRDLIQDEALRARGRHKPQNPTAPAGKGPQQQSFACVCSQPGALLRCGFRCRAAGCCRAWVWAFGSHSAWASWSPCGGGVSP